MPSPRLERTLLLTLPERASGFIASRLLETSGLIRWAAWPSFRVMARRRDELIRQRTLLARHLEWLDLEIARTLEQELPEAEAAHSPRAEIWESTALPGVSPQPSQSRFSLTGPRSTEPCRGRDPSHRASARALRDYLRSSETAEKAARTPLDDADPGAFSRRIRWAAWGLLALAVGALGALYYAWPAWDEREHERFQGQYGAAGNAPADPVTH